MKAKKLINFLGLILFYISLSISTLYAGEKSKTIEGFPDYSDVDVVIECEWGLDGKIENAKVYDHSDAKEPHLRISNAEEESSVLTLIKGIKVNILDHKNHKLLKTYVGKYVQP
jgi:hypothetical protein